MIDIAALGAQLINILIIFFIFHKLLAKPLAHGLEQRQKLLDKLQNAQKEYDEMIASAHKERDAILSAAHSSAANIMEKAHADAKARSEEIISQAEQKSHGIIEDAQEKVRHMERELAQEFDHAVKASATIAVKKLLSEDVQLNEKYLSSISAPLGK